MVDALLSEQLRMTASFRNNSFVYHEQNVRIFDGWQSVSYDDGRPTFGSLWQIMSLQ